jgi:hypothetical protein
LDLPDIIIIHSVWRRRIAQNAYRGLVLAKRDKSALMIMSAWRSHDELLALFGRRVDHAKHCTAIECETSVRCPSYRPCINYPDSRAGNAGQKMIETHPGRDYRSDGLAWFHLLCRLHVCHI